VSLPAQTAYPGVLTNAWHREMQALAAKNTVTRFWEQDASLWPAEEHQRAVIESNLGWLNLPEQIEPYIVQVVERAVAAQREGWDSLVFIAISSSNLAGAAVLHLPEANVGKQTYLLDSTDPDTLRDLESKLSFERTLFVVTNKSGKRIETHALLLYFLDRLRAAGVASPGEHFVALTEEGSYLATLARTYKFRDIFFDPPGICGRYSGLIHFSLLVTAICRVNRTQLLETIGAMKDACGPLVRMEENPAVVLASFLAAGEREGLNRLILLTGEELSYFAYRIAQLVGTSTSRNGRGLVPIFTQSSYALDILERKCLVVILTLRGQAKDQPDPSLQLRERGIPVLRIELESPMDFAAEIFKWEMATALACAALGVNCFQDDGQGDLGVAAARLESLVEKRESLLPPARIKEGGLFLYVVGRTRRLISGLSLRAAVQDFLELRNSDGYIAICPFFELTPGYLEVLRALQHRMRKILGMPIEVLAGPRYLYALGKTYKKDPGNGVFLILTAEPREDVAIPGAGYTFGELQLALGLAECDALEGHQKRTIRLHLSQGAENGLKQFSDIVIQALARIPGDAG
jgi:transaldolase/glucose-6-phosphate isomerase